LKVILVNLLAALNRANVFKKKNKKRLKNEKNVKNVKKRFVHLWGKCPETSTHRPSRRHTVARLAGFFASTVPLLAASRRSLSCTACTPAFSYNGAI